MKVLIKAMRPHRQKVLTEDGEEMRLQQWANKAASSALRGAGGDASGEQFTQARDALMREAVANPNEHGLKFMGKRMPFDGQELEESLSDPMDSPEFKEDMTEDESFSLAEKLDEKDRAASNLFDSEGKLRDGMPQGGKMNEKDMHDEALADWEARQSDIDFSRNQGHTDGYEGKPYHDMEQEELDADKKRFYGMYPHLQPQEQGGFDPDAEAEHMRRIMTSRQVPMRDAWSVLKNDFFNPPEVPCAKCGKPTEPMMYYGSNQMGPQHNTLCEECEDNTMMEDQ